MKNRILMLTLSVVLLAGLVGGGTMAWFTDSATNIGNVFTAGNLDIVVNDDVDDTVETAFATFTNIFPGWESPEEGRTFTVANPAGNLDAQVRMFFTRQTGSNLALANGLQFRYTFAQGAGAEAPGFSDPFVTAWMAMPATHIDIYVTNLPNGQRAQFRFQFRLLSNVGNAAQGQFASYDIVVHATQIGNPGWREDGFHWP